MEYIANSFSLQMLELQGTATIKIEPVDSFPASAVSFVGHADTAAVLGVPYNRGSLTLRPGDVLYVAQLVGGRLPEGATTLPEGFSFRFFRVTLLD